MGKKITVGDVLKGYGKEPVEIAVSERCEHGCVDVCVSSPAIWRWPHREPSFSTANQNLIVHNRCEREGDLELCIDTCFE